MVLGSSLRQFSRGLWLCFLDRLVFDIVRKIQSRFFGDLLVFFNFGGLGLPPARVLAVNESLGHVQPLRVQKFID